MIEEIEQYQTGDLDQPVTREQIGQAANDISRRQVFDDFRDGKSANTIRRYRHELGRFADWYFEVEKRANGKQPGEKIERLDLYHKPQDWKDITWGTVKQYRDALRDMGFAIGTINISLSTVRCFAKLAYQAGHISDSEYRLISTVKGYSSREAVHVDDKRKANGIKTRIGGKGAKKARFVRVSNKQAKALKEQPETAQGRRDQVLMCLLIDHGMRVSEVAGLLMESVDLAAEQICFERPKVRGTEHERTCQELSQDTKQAAGAYVALDCQGRKPSWPLLQGSVKGGELTGAMTTRAIAKRVRYLGEQVGISGLSPHDLRHYAATRDVKRLKIHELRDKFGWRSLEMPNRYIERSKVVKVE